MLEIRYKNIFNNENVINTLLNYFKGKNILNIYIDIKNSIFRPHLESDLSMLNPKIEISNMLSSFIEFTYLIENSFKNKFNKINFYFYGEYGKSGYHKNIYKDYKENRQKDSLNRDNLKNLNSIIHIASQLGEQILNFKKNTYFIYIPYIEMDAFIYYHMKYKQEEKYNANILLSGDKDNLQLFTDFANLIIIDKGVKRSKNFTIDFMLIGKENYLKRIISKKYIKDNSILKYIDENKLLLLYRSIIGDTSDNVKGIYRIGEKRVMDLFYWLYENPKSDIIKCVPDYINEIIESNGNKDISIFNDRFIDIELLENELKILLKNKLINKTLYNTFIKLYENQDIIYRNFRLFSYELIVNKLFIKFEELYEKLFQYEKIKNDKNFINFLYNSKIFIESDFNKIGKVIELNAFN